MEKADKGNKAASQRVRTSTVKLEKTAKLYRKESIRSEKTSTKAPKKAAKKAAPKKAAKAKSAHKAPKHGKVKAKAKAHKAVSKPRALSFKKPTAKLPFRR